MSIAMDGASSLTARTLAALNWRMGFLAVKVVLHLGVMAILARLLPVSAFGLLGQAMIVMGMLLVISEVGMAAALIHKQDLTETHIRVAYTLSLLTGLLLTVAVWVTAPALAALLGSRELTPLLRALSPALLFTSLNAIATALLRRELNFRGLFFAELAAYVIGYAGLGVGLALLGVGVWALALATVAQAVLGCLLVVLIAPTPVRFGLRWAEARSLGSLAGGMSASWLVLYAARNLDYALVGRVLGAEALGFYSRAYTLMTLPISRFSGAGSMVLAPAYAKIQDDTARLRRVYYDNLAAAALVVFPVLTGMGVAAPEIVEVLLGARWRPAAVPLQLLSAAGAFLCVHNLGDTLGRALGDVGGRLWRYVAYNALVLLFVSVGLRWGIRGAAGGMLAALAIQYLLMAQLTIRLTAGSWGEFFRAQALGAGLALLTAVTALGIAAPLRSMYCPAILTLLATTAGSAAMTGIALFALPRHRLPGVAVLVLTRVERSLAKFGGFWPPRSKKMSLSLIRRALGGLVGRLRLRYDAVAYFRSLGARIGRDCRIIRPERAMFGSEPYLVRLGDHVTVGEGVRFITHDGGVWVLRESDPSLDVMAPITVGSNVFLGTYAIIMPGVTIGDDCVIGAGSVVTRSIAPGTVAAGAPARPIKSIDEYRRGVEAKAIRVRRLSPAEKRRKLEELWADVSSPARTANIPSDGRAA